MKKSFIVSILILASGHTIAQVNIDSLHKIWNDNTQADTIRLDAVYQILSDRNWNNTDTDSSIYLANEMEIFAKKSEHKKYHFKSIVAKASIHTMDQKYSEAIKLANKGLEIAKEINFDMGISKIYAMLATISYRVGDFEKLVFYQEKSLDSALKTENQKEISWQLHNLGYAYQEIKDYESALKYYNQSLNLSRKHNIIVTEANCLSYIGETYQLLGEFKKAQKYFHESLRLKEVNNISFEIPWTLAKSGEGLFAMRDYKEAINACDKAYNLSEKTDDARRVACHCLYESYKHLGQFKKSLKYYEEWHALNINLNKTETNVLLQQVDFKNKLVLDSLKQAEATRLVKESHLEEVRLKNQTRNLLAGGGFILFLLAGGLFTRIRFIRKSKAILQTEKDRSESLLLNILPAEIAEELKLKGSAVARDFDQVSILFTDFKEFTQISEKLSAKDLVAEINHCFKTFDGLCEKYKVEKIKTIGDSYMAAGGLPVPHENSVKNTVLAALEMSTFIVNRKAVREAAGQIPFEMRTGIHTGNVVAGIVGVKKFQYDVWGDTVNTASRMESNGKVGEVNISHSTYELLKSDPDFVFESRGKIQAKGKGEIEMYFVNLS